MFILNLTEGGQSINRTAYKGNSNLYRIVFSLTTVHFFGY